MAMTVMNNTSAMMALGELKKNTNSMGKDLKKISSGMKINSAGDGASEYAISEKMRVRIRALNQDDENTQTGMSLLRVAEGGIQNQIELLKTVKAKVIDAANDTNTENDREIIQKEISQCYDQMQDLAALTDYNTQRVLLGYDYWKTVHSWIVEPHSQMIEESDSMGVIPDVYDELDGVKGPFDIFDEYNIMPVDLPSVGVTGVPQHFLGGADGNPNTIKVDLSTYSTVAELNNVGFSFEGNNYVLAQNPSAQYRNHNFTIIDISGCLSIDDVANAIAAKISSASASGSVVTFQTTDNREAEISNAKTVTGYSAKGGTETISSGGHPRIDIDREAVDIDETGSSTGKFTPDKYLSGGDNPFYDPYNDADSVGSYPGKKSSLSENISSVPDGSGVTVHGPSMGKIRFVDGTSGFSYDGTKDVWTVGKSGKGSANIGGLDVSLSGGTITFTAPSEGTQGDQYYVSDGYTVSIHKPAVHIHEPAVPPTVTTVTYMPIKDINSDAVTNLKTATDGTYASFDMDLSLYADSTDKADLEKVIKELYGTAINHSGTGYEFVDSGVLGLGNVNKVGGAKMDLNEVRRSVNNGESIGNALSKLLKKHIPDVKISKNANGNANKVTVRAFTRGVAGNSETICSRKGTLRSYDVDYGTWFKNNPDANIPTDLYGKGFRFYCASCNEQWFNIIFTPDMEDDSGNDVWQLRPESGTATEDIKSILVDVSKVKDAASLVKTIYEIATPVLEGEEKQFMDSKVSYNHFMRLAANTETGVLTVYDNRRHPLESQYYNELQEKGAKIADGVFDNVIPDERDLSCKEIIIHDTDKSSANIRVYIPRTTLDHIFSFNPDNYSIDTFNVLTQNHRDKLLGTDKKPGILDKGIRYLLDAATIVGTQSQRVQSSNNNIITNMENTQAAESTIRDTDMAKVMTSFTKNSILSQSAQTILAQANQNSSQVISLLQQ